MDSWLILRSKRVILNQWTKRNFSKASFIWCLFPSDKRSWMFRRQVQHSMESAHHFSSRPDCNNTAEVPSFALRAALSAIPFVSDRCGVDVQWFQERSSQALPNSKELSVLMTFGSLSGSRYFCKLLWVSCEVCVLHGYDWIHWGSQVLHHDCISMTVSKFTENFVICYNQITKIFCTKYDFAIASSACPFTDLAISVFREMSFNTVLTQILTSLCSRL